MLLQQKKKAAQGEKVRKLLEIKAEEQLGKTTVPLDGTVDDCFRQLERIIEEGESCSR